MKTKLGQEVPESTRGILYLCHFTKDKITVVTEMLFTSGFEALNAYANITNPESQMVSGDTYEKVIEELEKLHTYMDSAKWLKALGECI